MYCPLHIAEQLYEVVDRLFIGGKPPNKITPLCCAVQWTVIIEKVRFPYLV